MTLTLHRPFAKNQPYQLTILDRFMADAAGNLIDGDGDGRPGGNAVFRFGAAPRASVSARAVDALSAAQDLPRARPRRRSGL